MCGRVCSYLTSLQESPHKHTDSSVICRKKQLTAFKCLFCMHLNDSKKTNKDYSCAWLGCTVQFILGHIDVSPQNGYKCTICNYYRVHFCNAVSVSQSLHHDCSLMYGWQRSYTSIQPPVHLKESWQDFTLVFMTRHPSDQSKHIK